MDLSVNIFIITTLLATVLVSVFGQEEDGYVNRRRRPRPRPDSQGCIQVGVCGGFVGASCPRGSTCRRIWPTQTAGPCCLDRPDPPHNTCLYGPPGRSCRQSRQCRPGYTCQIEPGRRRGTCCRSQDPPNNTCLYGQPGGSCIGSRQCRPGYTCQTEPGRRSGTCCRRQSQGGTCPPSSGRPGICVFDPRVNCSSNSECRRGQICCPEGCGRVCKNLDYFPNPYLLGQGEGYGRQRRPAPGPGSRQCRWGSVGVCGGFANARCPHGSTCQLNWQTQTAGPCCRDRPESCPYGQNGVCGTIAGRMCGPGTTCRFMGNFPDAAGKCCWNRPVSNKGTCPPSSGRAGICIFDPSVNCLSNRDCSGGQICCREGCGKVCKNPVYLPDPISY
ncbi:uncharacterized protein K04H4.2-like [Mercenaria mercenaria]|uniref:uncharacterized protein K04H4.2-like n=1 Tax=Mercenaria mercenaria TaxID=6596 RepID=UPI00234E89B0|nr:uncharacterized protein K04H4.2-like [Mercenaria mercenaria]